MYNMLYTQMCIYTLIHIRVHKSMVSTHTLYIHICLCIYTYMCTCIHVFTGITGPYILY